MQQGRWRQRISSYAKLRLAPERIEAALGGRGFAVQRDMANGMVRIVATKA